MIPITITEAAKQRVIHLIEKRDKPAAGIRVGLRTSGCNGLSYTIEYVDEIGKFDEAISIDGSAYKVVIDPKASLFLFGTEMDFVEEKMKSGFTFRNPNEKGRCGCGKSFNV